MPRDTRALIKELRGVADELYEYTADYNPEIEWGDMYVFRFRFDFDSLEMKESDAWEFFNDNYDLVEEIVYSYLEKKIQEAAKRFDWIDVEATLDDLFITKQVLVVYSLEPLESVIESMLEKIRSEFWGDYEEHAKELRGLIDLVKRRVYELRQLEGMIQQWERELNSESFWRKQYREFQKL